MEAYIQIGLFLTLLAIGFFAGRYLEQRHFTSIIAREKQLLPLLTYSERVIPEQYATHKGELVCGNVVVSVDYFKVVSAALRKLVGGRVQAYESLMERGRREAILRMKEAAQAKGASAIFNVRIETASISKGQNNQIGCVEVYAYGTALIP